MSAIVPYRSNVPPPPPPPPLQKPQQAPEEEGEPEDLIGRVKKWGSDHPFALGIMMIALGALISLTVLDPSLIPMNGLMIAGIGGVGAFGILYLIRRFTIDNRAKNKIKPPQIEGQPKPDPLAKYNAFEKTWVRIHSKVGPVFLAIGISAIAALLMQRFLSGDMSGMAGMMNVALCVGGGVLTAAGVILIKLEAEERYEKAKKKLEEDAKAEWEKRQKCIIFGNRAKRKMPSMKLVENRELNDGVGRVARGVLSLIGLFGLAALNWWLLSAGPTNSSFYFGLIIAGISVGYIPTVLIPAWRSKLIRRLV